MQDTINRRTFLTAAAGVAFCGCALKPLSVFAQTARPRLPVAVSGRRIKTVDVHAHCIFREAERMLGVEGPGPTASLKGAEKAFITIDQRLADMDAMAIDMEILSINPTWYERDRDLAEAVCKLQNERLAELCGSKPDRFGAFATLAMQYPDLAVQQLDTAVKRLGLRGAGIGGTIAGLPLSDPKFHPVWAKAEELGAVIFVHPRGLPEMAKHLAGNGWLSNTISTATESAIAISHLVFEGTLDRFPGLKMIFAHGGGYLPSYAHRSDRACYVNPGNCNPNIQLKKKPSEYLKQLYYDSIIFTPEGLRHLVAEVGASQIMLGTDHPYPWEEHPVDLVLATTSLSDDQKIAILGGNAARVFGKV